MKLKIFENRLANGIITPLVAGVVLTILAPFGTDDFGLFSRSFYWIGLTVAGGLGAMSINALLNVIRPDASVLIRALVQSLGATLAVAPFVIGLQWDGGLFGNLLSLFYIWVIAIVISTIAELTARRSHTEPVPSIRPPLFDRLPPKFRDTDLYAINSEDHYVRIHSAVGEHMLLMRLSDAEDLALPIIGLKPHRSWWVAEIGVDEVYKTDGKLQIKLKSGVIVPVSREGAKRVREAGWV